MPVTLVAQRRLVLTSTSEESGLLADQNPTKLSIPHFQRTSFDHPPSPTTSSSLDRSHISKSSKGLPENTSAQTIQYLKPIHDRFEPNQEQNIRIQEAALTQQVLQDQHHTQSLITSIHPSSLVQETHKRSEPDLPNLRSSHSSSGHNNHRGSEPLQHKVAFPQSSSSGQESHRRSEVVQLKVAFSHPTLSSQATHSGSEHIHRNIASSHSSHTGTFLFPEQQALPLKSTGSLETPGRILQSSEPLEPQKLRQASSDSQKSLARPLSSPGSIVKEGSPQPAFSSPTPINSPTSSATTSNSSLLFHNFSENRKLDNRYDRFDEQSLFSSSCDKGSTLR